MIGVLSDTVCHLVTVNLVNHPFPVRKRVDLAAVVVGVVDARGRTRFVAGAFTTWVHQVCGGRLRDHLARLARLTYFELSTKIYF